MDNSDVKLKRERFLGLIDERAQEVDDFYKSYCGPGTLMCVNKLLKYRIKYVEYALAKLGVMAGREVKIKTFWGRKINMILGDQIVLHLFGLLGGAEQKLAKFFIKNLKLDSIFYDVGTNIGFYSFLAGEFIESGEIHAFEPSADAFGCLAKSGGGDKKYFFNNFALSDVAGEIPYYVNATHGSGGNTIMDAVVNADTGDYKKIKTRAETFDWYISSHKKPTVVKIDVEGAEAKVLRGGLKFFKEFSPVVSVEVWYRELGENISMNAIKALRGLGYETYRISDNGDIVRDELNVLASTEDISDNIVLKKRV